MYKCPEAAASPAGGKRAGELNRSEVGRGWQKWSVGPGSEVWGLFGQRCPCGSLGAVCAGALSSPDSYLRQGLWTQRASQLADGGTGVVGMETRARSFGALFCRAC